MAQIEFETIPSEEEKKNFVEYLLLFYRDMGMSRDIATKVMWLYLNGCYLGTNGYHLWGGGDSLDRERCYEIYCNLKEVELCT